MIKKEDLKNLDTFPRFDHPEMKFKNEKLDLSMMCSFGACRKIFGSLQHLKHHYKVCHPDAIFEVDFPHDDFIVNE